MKMLKAEGEIRAWEMIDRVADGIEAELTPEQKVKWAEIRPKRPE